MSSKKDDVTREGVRDGWDLWLQDHPVSVPAMIEAAVKAAMREWLDANAAEIVRSEVARAVTTWGLTEDAPPSGRRP